MPRYVTVDLFGKVGVGKTTIFNLFAGDKYLQEGGNLSYDFRGYYARCWILPNRWSHSMIFLSDPKFEWFWKDLNINFLRKLFEPTNVLIIVSDSTKEDILNIKRSLAVFPRIKRKLIIFIIANMQDLEDRLTPDEIKKILGMNEVLGVSAIQEGAKEKIEAFIEEAVKRYFLLLSKRGEAMDLVDENHNFFSTHKQENDKKPEKENLRKMDPKRLERSRRLKEIAKKIDEIQKSIDNRLNREEREKWERIQKHKEELMRIRKKLEDLS